MSENIQKVQENVEITCSTITSQKSSDQNENTVVDTDENGYKDENSAKKDDNLECLKNIDNSTISNSDKNLTCEYSTSKYKLQSDDDNSDNDTDDLVNKFAIVKKTKKSTMFDSDSENEEIPISNETSKPDSADVIEEPKLINIKKRRKIAFLDSDSEPENDDDYSNQNSGSNAVLEYKSVDQNENGEKEQEIETQKEIISALCDSESSDEANENYSEKEPADISDTELEGLKSNEVTSKARKGKSKPKFKDQTEKMTAKKALEERKEILAESQRRVRESRVSLPYHKPKPRSLKEFLQNRPKLASPLSNVSQGASPSLSLKMSMKQLEVLTQKMKERKKEVEEFYKSESDSEHEEALETANVEISSAQNAEDQGKGLSINEYINPENIPQENLEIDNAEKISAEETNLIENQDPSKNMLDPVVEKKIEISETVCPINVECKNSSSEMINLGTSEKYETCFSKECGESNMSIQVDHSENSPNKSEIAEESTKTENEDEKKVEKSLAQSDKIILHSDVLVIPTKSNESNNIYNLDSELLELATEVEKEDEEQNDSYEFNLDDIDEESEFILENGEMIKKQSKPINGLKKRSELLEKLGELKPRLSVGPNQVIDLENGIAMPDEISQLRERFFKHNLKLEKHLHKKEISIMSVSNGQIHKETLALRIDDNDDEDMMPLEKPGVRLQKLREELQHQMAQKRSELWKEKLTKKVNNEKLDVQDDNDEKSECGAKDILDDEEEEDFTDPEEDEELDENDCDMSEKKRKKSNFVDEEAEESDIEETDDAGDLLNENEEDEEGCDDTDEENKEADVEDDQEMEDIEENTQKKKVLKRIIKPFDEDSDEEDMLNRIQHKLEIPNNTKLENLSDSKNLTLRQTNFITKEPLLISQKSDDHFATPVTYMTGLKNLNTSGLKFMPPENSVIEDDGSLEKSKLHNESENIGNSQVDSQNMNQNFRDHSSLSTQDVLDICSGPFQNSLKSVSSPEISTQQLREVFTGSMKSSDFNTQDVDDICSGGFTGISQTTQAKEKDMVLDDNDEHFISQLIDEDELENFKKKFESPGLKKYVNIQRNQTYEEAEEVVGTGGVIDSDDDNEEGLQLKNKKKKRLAFSDDEESSTSETPQEETINLQDDEDLSSNVDYDSEENEVENTGENVENKKEKIKIADFFEAEAELSESEWGSEDEDERNLDDLEFEKGDEEKFDEDKLRTDIEKLQMRQMLDEDNREVKMLQELLLEDGELHGTGRQRQFRWKNIDATGNGIEEKKDDDDDVYLEEDESEEQWRKERHKREMFKLQKQSQEEDSLIIESQSLSFTHKSLKIKSQTIISPQVTSNEVDISPKIKQPFALLNKRGSFLSRGEKILQKIAETSKVSFSTKNTNRIVFRTIDEDTKKRKASSSNIDNSTPVALKKLRLSGLSPGLNQERQKPGRTLFGKIFQD